MCKSAASNSTWGIAEPQWVSGCGGPVGAQAPSQRGHSGEQENRVGCAYDNDRTWAESVWCGLPRQDHQLPGRNPARLSANCVAGCESKTAPWWKPKTGLASVTGRSSFPRFRPKLWPQERRRGCCWNLASCWPCGASRMGSGGITAAAFSVKASAIRSRLRSTGSAGGTCMVGRLGPNALAPRSLGLRPTK